MIGPVQTSCTRRRARVAEHAVAVRIGAAADERPSQSMTSVLHGQVH